MEGFEDSDHKEIKLTEISNIPNTNMIGKRRTDGDEDDRNIDEGIGNKILDNEDIDIDDILKSFPIKKNKMQDEQDSPSYMDEYNSIHNPNNDHSDKMDIERISNRNETKERNYYIKMGESLGISKLNKTLSTPDRLEEKETLSRCEIESDNHSNMNLVATFRSMNSPGVIQTNDSFSDNIESPDKMKNKVKSKAQRLKEHFRTSKEADKKFMEIASSVHIKPEGPYFQSLPNSSITSVDRNEGGEWILSTIDRVIIYEGEKKKGEMRISSPKEKTDFHSLKGFHTRKGREELIGIALFEGITSPFCLQLIVISSMDITGSSYHMKAKNLLSNRLVRDSNILIMWTAKGISILDLDEDPSTSKPVLICRQEKICDISLMDGSLFFVCDKQNKLMKICPKLADLRPQKPSSRESSPGWSVISQKNIIECSLISDGAVSNSSYLTSLRIRSCESELIVMCNNYIYLLSAEPVLKDECQIKSCVDILFFTAPNPSIKSTMKYVISIEKRMKYSILFVSNDALSILKRSNDIPIPPSIESMYSDPSHHISIHLIHDTNFVVCMHNHTILYNIMF